MASKARDAMGCEELTVLAECGYGNGEQVLACEENGALPLYPEDRVAERSLLHAWRLRLPRRERSLHVPRGPKADQDPVEISAEVAPGPHAIPDPIR
jgi:hypothetical protein